MYWFDKNNIPVCVGDLLRVFHFIGPRNKKFYMYKVAMEIPSRRKGMVAVCIRELATKGIAEAHYCDMAALGEFEILDGMGGFGLPDWEYFNKRPKQVLDYESTSQE